MNWINKLNGLEGITSEKKKLAESSRLKAER
jgi:hypothetical protein